VRGIQDEVIGQREQSVGQRPVQRARHVLDRVVAVRVQVRPAGVPDEQRVAGEDEPRLVAAAVVGHEIGVMSRRVPGGRNRLQLGVAERDDLAVGEWVMSEVDAGVLRQVGRRPGPGDQLRQPGDMVSLDVRLEHSGDPRALRFGERDVVVHQVDVRIDDGELADRLAAEQVGGTGGVVVEQLSDEHGLTSYQAIY
jgi:hypothetical protein